MVAAPELRLLKLSILEDGWTQPIVATPDTGEVVDGFHRWTLAHQDTAIAGMTGALVPIVHTRHAGLQERMASTIRHNRARGVHGIRPMAAIVRNLADEHGLDAAQIGKSLGMDSEEVSRLLDVRGMPEKSGEEFGKGWVPSKSKG